MEVWQLIVTLKDLVASGTSISYKRGRGLKISQSNPTVGLVNEHQRSSKAAAKQVVVNRQ